MQNIYSHLMQELHRHAKATGASKAVLALSGGLDSVVTLCLAVRAFGARNVYALSMPEGGVTSQADLQSARLIAEHYGCPYFEQSINNFVMDFNFVPWQKTEMALHAAKARTRSTLLQHLAVTEKALTLSSRNKSDLLLGFGHIDGEFFGEIHPLGDLYKTEVQTLGEFIGLPEEILRKAPTRGLQANLTDENELGATWPLLDDVLKELSTHRDPEELIQKGLDPHFIHRISRLMEAADPALKNLLILPKEAPGTAIKKAQAVEATS
jgi:NAD+ synthase